VAEIIEPKIKELPAWTLEDFENAVPHGWLYSNYHMNPFTYRKALMKVDETARQLGYSGFKSEMRDYAKEAGERINERDYANTTDFSGQPLTLDCGQYICTDDGVMLAAYGDTTVVCPHPIMLSGRLVNLDSGEVRLEVSFRRGAEWRTVVIEKVILASAAKIIDLARLGIAVDSENAKTLVKYFTDLEAMNYDRLPERHSVARVGWTTSGKFVPYADSVEFDGAPGFRAVFDSFHPNGDRDAWFKAASKARNESTIARIVLAASLASALVNPLHALPFFVHVWGRAGNGKTMLLKLAASVWASPNSSEGYIRNFNSTFVGLETAAGFFNSAPLCVDELQVVKNRRDFDDIIYMLAEGQGRSRGSKDGSLQQIKSWQNTIITTGEMPISADNSGAGALNRVIEIACGDERLLDDYRGLSDALSHNWGFAGKEFVEGLTPQVLEAAKKVQEEYRAAFEASATTEKLALSASLILTADAVAELLIWHTGTALSAADVAKYLPTKQDVDVNQRALEWLYGTIAENRSKFVAEDGMPMREVWGEYKDISDGKPFIAIIGTVLSRIMADAGFNYKAFLSWARDRGHIRAGEKNILPVRVHGVVSKCVCLYESASGEGKLVT
jgi:uncharacterized protein (DUF927 family)